MKAESTTVVGICVAVVVFALGGATGAVIEIKSRTERVHAELCPTILALSPTAADSLAVFREHEGCFEFVQSEAP